MAEMTVQRIEEATILAAREMTDAGDALHAKQVMEVHSKLAEGRLTVAFCGHFSAGKSTLINRLCGAQLLPSSPIPTSANVVSIRGGAEARASIITEKDGKASSLSVSLEDLDRYCVDGEQFQSVSITYPTERLGNHTVLLDTPGIDSTDDAHRMATESALHLADVVFYVMDYNHVQSEINFAFAKQLKDWGKPLYFIVNQIDKHRERELTFAEYRKSVEEAFQAWHLEPAGIVYLSLRQPDHPHQEWEALTRLLDELKELREPLAAYSVDASLRHLAAEHLKWCEMQDEPEKERLLAEAGGEEEAQRVKTEQGELMLQTKQLEAEPERLRLELRRDLQALVDNAIITPAPVRDLAHAFLESRKPGFKTGLLFAGAKTAAEQERRAELFCHDFAGQVNAAVDWHVKDLLRRAAEKVGYAAETLEQQLAEQFSWKPDTSWLIQRVNTGAVFGNEYTMTYTRELAAEVKELYRKRGNELIDALTAHVAAASETAAADVRGRLAALDAQAGALGLLAALAERAAQHAAQVAGTLPQPVARPALPAPKRAAADARARAGVDGGAADAAAGQELGRASEAAQRGDGAAAGDAAAARASGAGVAATPAQTALGSGEALSQQHGAAARLLSAAALLTPHAPLAAAAQAMQDKANRLRSSRFTIALFGAFSAGKSSLANALIGEPVLPVSPNPTTAAINRLVPPSGGREHGTAGVVMKSRDAVLEDLRYSLALLGEDASDAALPDAAALMRAIDRLSPDAIHAGGRPHYSFLRAARAGWEEHEALLGQRLTVSQAEYERFVAEESRSCYVSEIELYYDCELTRQGIVLVDTPGADSVNARHTGVAFNYIKNADAVLFVTYYNHAFSQADRQFLMQLGRVKDQFELDKMFFLVNAADLAADQEELAGVLKHVEHNLLQHGIRSPRLYPVSSLDGLDAKQNGDGELLERSGIDAFERSFLHFVSEDLGRLAIDAAEQEIVRAAATVNGWLNSATGDAATREQELRGLAALQEQAQLLLASYRSSEAPPQQAQELSELLYYVVQRQQLRFGEFYNYAFNPSVLQDDGRDLKKMIWTAWLDLQRQIQMELAQELQATSLRLERILNGLLRKQFDSCASELAALLTGYQSIPYETAAIPTPEIDVDWTTTDITGKWLWSRFKSPRQFFEGDGKGQLRKELEALLIPSLQQWMAAENRQWTERYSALWKKYAEQSGEQLQQDVVNYVEGKRISLADNADVGQLRELHQQLIHLHSATIA
ncbi:dynamin family protein [Paenibacillus sp. FSL H8-0537]|uniref:dynamin family protein n=1 Tax=Paenibacillus sp. FSL H8-0537 TaxID=2921399 RepID=UPI003101A9D1